MFYLVKQRGAEEVLRRLISEFDYTGQNIMIMLVTEKMVRREKYAD